MNGNVTRFDTATKSGHFQPDGENWTIYIPPKVFKKSGLDDLRIDQRLNVYARSKRKKPVATKIQHVD